MESTPPVQIPSNVMIKSAYPLTAKKEPSYIADIVNELYNYVYNKTSSLYWENIEIEAKLGNFNFRGEMMHSMQFIRETFKIPSFHIGNKSLLTKYKVDFRSGMDEKQFYTVWYFVEKECERIGSGIVRVDPINYRETHYNSGKRKSVAHRNGKIVKEEVILKEDKHHINIRNNGDDFRITACKEMKTDILEEDIPSNYREKFRVSYKFRFFRLDFTIVTSYKEKKDRDTPDISYEIEFEFDELKKFLQPAFCKSYDEFKIMITRFIQNVFCIYQTLSVDFYNNFLVLTNTGDSDKDRKSIFGDYFEKNLTEDN